MVRMGLLALGLVAALSSGAWAQADDDGLAIATITSVSGPLRARLQPFTSYDAPTSVEIGAGSQVTVVHHRSCEKVEISAGRLDVSFAGVETTGTITRRERTACPGMTMAETSGVAGGVLMRSSRPGAAGLPTVTVVLDGGPRVKAGSTITMTVTAGIPAAVFVYDQDQSGVLTLIQKPPTTGGRTAITAAGAPVAVPDRPSAKIQVAAEPGEGRVIAFAVPAERSPCGYLDLFETVRPGTLKDLSNAIQNRKRAVAACAPVPRAPLLSDILYTIVR